MSSMQTTVLIIGGGLGGLALAQSLRKKGVAFEVFERDSSEEARSQGWAISLHDWFIENLLEATKEDLPDLEKVGNTYDIGVPAEGAIFNGHSMEELRRFGGTGSRFIRADRAKLRDWLVTHLNVHWGKKFKYYEQDANGVTAFFEDGTSYRGEILVGADGINSHVRAQLLPDPAHRPAHLPMGLIIGELTASEEQYQRWLKIAASFFIGPTDTRRLFVGLKSVASDKKTARYYWMFGWTDEEAQSSSFWTASASKEELHSYVMNHLDGIHPDFAEAYHATPVDGMLHPPLLLRDMTPPELPKGRVTLLGDAVHPMVPFQGQGGNQAMEDGFSLASCLGAENGMGLEDKLKQYEMEMTPRATKAVLASRAASDPSYRY